MAIAKCVLPVPIGPAKIRFSGAAIEGLHLGKARLAQPLPDDGLVPRGLLGGEDLMEIILMGPVGIARLTCQRFKGARDPWQFQRPRLRDDQIAGEGRRAHAAPPKSQPS